ncbi:Glycosyl hydrolase family 9 [Fibrobacter sp. UWH9]|uniref:glycoside hydrolase family 9 protein n=1 Tax=unclassified Fibrobacter TaxID=2634177 RepID=UPI00091A56B9|nr:MULTISPECIES: glycoside hydrolase family 9 protein [unclassified Fibrobacter]SHH03006.1 Glycosyl hydrolase family 9 [Fibrobacter sp. UWH9]
MPFFVVPVLLLATALFAVEQEQPTPYDLIRPIWPMTWDTAATDEGGTVQSFSKYVPNAKKHNTVPAVGSMPQDFVPNGLIPDSLNQAFRDAQNLRIGRIRINQAGYLPDDPEMQFYYVSDGNCTETYSVVDLDGNEVAKGGTFMSSGLTTTSSWNIKAGTDAATANQGRYTSSADAPEGKVCIGNLTQLAGGLAQDTRYRVKVLKQYSSTFIISPRVYSMVRDALLKFYGVNRSGNSESWFHKPSHTKDGGGPVVNNITAGAAATPISPKEGDLQGGWYDCGDHLKESYTQAYAFMVLAITAAGNPDRDDDNYAYNHAETVNTDGIPDILREAKHGADYFLRAYRVAGGIVDNMPVSVGNFGADHGWWGRPENQDALPATLKGRGGPHERDVRLGELGANVSSEIAAGLAILGKEYAFYDKAFADSCKMAAVAIYEFARALALDQPTYGNGLKFNNNKEKGEWGTPAYSGSNSYIDDISIAAVALHYGTYPDSGMKYLNDAVEDKTIGTDQEPGVGFFRGGWMAAKRDGMRKSSNTDWANVQTYALYGFYKLLLKNDSISTHYGITHDERLWYAENVAFMLANNVAARSGTGSTSIPIPNPSDGTKNVSASDLWYQMQTQMAWIYNRYQAGNIFDVFAYADVTKDLEGVRLPQKGVQNWNSEKMKQLGINQLNYLFGVNPWDISFMIGVGDKSDNHPHHRAANPEGKNMPGAGYTYKPPVGALFGGVPPEGDNEWDPSTLSWEDYYKSETCIDATAMFLAAASAAIKEEDRNRAPSEINVEIRYVGYNSAIIKVGQDVRGPAMILYSTNETGPFNTPVKDTINSVTHEFNLTELQNGTTYYFKVISINARSEAYTTKWLVDSTSTPFSFTTLVSPPGDADIQNVKICNLTADTAEVMWYTPNGQYESKVYWDTEVKPYDQMICPGAAAQSCDIVGNADVSGIPTSFHYVKFGDLEEQTTYYYCVESNGSIRCNDDKGQPLKFTTPVTRYNFDVSVYQYEFGGMDFLNLNLINNEDRQFDNIELRLYVTAKPEEIEAVPGVNNQPGTCPLLIDSDICQAYDEAGFNRPCVNAAGENVDDSLRYYLRHAVPVKLEDTYNPATGEYDWYIPIPLGGTLIKSSSRMRVDVGFSSGIYQNNMCETLRTPGKKRFLIPNTKDWTWTAHSREVDGADYAGVPSWEKDQGDIEQAPVNPYIAVYRKGEFISGFSPSYDEMINKRANYEITMSFDAPFNVSNGSYIQIDSTTSTMHVKGQAFITESGYVNSIWVNGVALTNEQLAKAAIYDNSTGRYALDIPVKLTIGTNKVDITVFAGPDPSCSYCVENGGCAFINRSYYIQFSKGDRTQSSLLLIAQDGNSVSSPAPIDGSNKFHIELRDKDNRNNSTVTVSVHNSRTKDSAIVTLKRTDENLGYFSSDMLNASASEGGLPHIPFYGGDTIMVKYVDAEDEDDRDSAWFYAEATKPTPKEAVVQNNVCTLTGDALTSATLTVSFDNASFDGTDIIMDSMIVVMESEGSSEGDRFTLVPTATVTGKEISFSVADSLVGANPVGKVIVYMREKGTASSAEVALTDRVKPKLTSVSILENEDHVNAQDTLKLVFSEPVNIVDTKSWPLSVYENQTAVDLSSIKVVSAKTDDNGKSWQYVIEGNENFAVKAGKQAEVPQAFNITDLFGNKLATCAPVTIIEAVRPVPVQYAKITDVTGDGQPDEIYVEFVRALRDKDIPDTIDVYWGNPAVYQAFTMPVNGWTREEIKAGTVTIYDTKLDSANGTWIKGSIQKTCVEFKDIIVVETDTTWNYTYPADDSTLAPTDSTVLKVDTTSTMTKQTCSTYETKQDSTFVPKIDTLGTKDSILYHSIIRVAVEKGIYKNMTYGSNKDPKTNEYKGTVRPRLGPIESQISDNTADLHDNCAPILLSAQWRGFDIGDEERGSQDEVNLTFSEPIDTVYQPRVVERSREGAAGVFYSPMNTPTLAMILSSGSSSIRLSYMHKEAAAIWIGDSLRMVSDISLGTLRDMAGNFPGQETPWVPVTGSVSNVKFTIVSTEPVTKSRNNYDVYYGGTPFAKGENFRLTAKNKAGETIILAAGDNVLNKVGSAPIPNYKSAGPVFEIEVALPFGNTREYGLGFDLSIFTNIGAYVINTHYADSTKYLKDFISAGSTITFYLEWCAPEDYPMSADGKKIGTGPYIAKFKTHASSTVFPEVKEAGDTREDISGSDTFTKTFGFRRIKQ